MLSSLKFILKSQFKCQSLEGGFTLIELLVSIILAALIITPVLGFMVNFLQTDQREQAKTSSEQEIQSALDYIAQDLKQAIYIYDQQGLTGNDQNGIAQEIDSAIKCPDNADSCEPVLVFWKRRFLSSNDKIGNKKVGDVTPGGNDTFAYSLVAYVLAEGNNGDGIWSDNARIVRYELREGKFCTARNNNGRCTNYDLPPNPDGFAPFDLSQSGSITSIMNQWQGVLSQPQSGDVLIDYIDDSNSAAPEILCKNDDDPDNPKRLPAQGTNIGFVACVDPSNLSIPSATVYLRGNALARVPTLKDENYEDKYSSFFPTSSTQVKGNSFIFAQ